jgi:hypothetical protein
LEIRDVYSGSRTFFHPGCEFFPSRIPDPGSASKNLSILNKKKWFPSSKKYDTACSSWIRIPGGSRAQKGTGYRIRIHKTVPYICIEYQQQVPTTYENTENLNRTSGSIAFLAPGYGV